MNVATGFKPTMSDAHGCCYVGPCYKGYADMSKGENGTDEHTPLLDEADDQSAAALEEGSADPGIARLVYTQPDKAVRWLISKGCLRLGSFTVKVCWPEVCATDNCDCALHCCGPAAIRQEYYPANQSGATQWTLHALICHSCINTAGLHCAGPAPQQRHLDPGN